MRSRIPILFFAVALVGALAARADETKDPGFSHRVMMKGSIVYAGEEGVILCIGTNDGASVGQELDVMRIKSEPGGSPKAAPRFSRAKVGKVRIQEIVDEHFAKAKVIEGEAAANDIVELMKAK